MTPFPRSEQRETVETVSDFPAGIGSTQLKVGVNERLLTGALLLLLSANALAAAPANDLFSNRIALAGSSILTTGSNAAATKEPGEPNHGGNAGGKSVWWSWTAPFTGGVTLTTAGSDFSTLLGVYTGTTVSNLVAVASDGRTNVPAVVTFRAVAGANYKIAIDGVNGAAGAILVSLTLAASPANDNWANRISIASGAIATASNLGATRELNEPSHAGLWGGKSLWWNWTASSNSAVTISTAGSDFDTLLGVYTNFLLVTPFGPVASNDDAKAAFTSSVSFNAVAGQNYFIAVDGYNAAAGNAVLQVTPFVAPTNDNFANFSVLSGTAVLLVTSNLCATKETGEPDHYGPGGKSLWWEWQAPAPGGVTIDLVGSDFDTEFAVYTGNTLASLSPIASGLDDVVFKATGGTKYKIAIDGSQVGSAPPQSGRIVFSLSWAPSPGNDDFANRFTLGAAATNGSNLGATTEPGEPSHAMAIIPGPAVRGRTVWWSWTANFTGPVSMATRNANFKSLIAVYTGNALGNLTRLCSRASVTPTNELMFHAMLGTTYQIAIDGAFGSSGSFSLSATPVAAPGNNDFAKRFPLVGPNVWTTGWNVGATRETGEPVHAGVSGSNSVWWSWSTQTSGRWFVSTMGSSCSPMLGVYQGTQVNTLSPIASGYGGQLCPRFGLVEFDVTVPTNCGPQLCSQIYQVAADSPTGQVGSIELTSAFVPRPANDNFAARIPLSGTFLTVTGSIVAATQEAGEIGGFTNGSRTVWYSWTAPTHPGAGAAGATLRLVSIGFGGSEQGLPLGIFQGNSIAGLIPVPIISEIKGNILQVTFEAISGATYQIAVAGPVWTGSGYDSSFAKRRSATPPDPLKETGSFTLRLNHSTLALRVRNVVPFELGFGHLFQKVPFGAEAQVLNYFSQPSGTVRVRLVGLARDGSTYGNMGTFLPITGNTVPADGLRSIPISGACPPTAGVVAVLEEEFGGSWFYRDSSLVLVGPGVHTFLCFTVTGGGVALLEPGLVGDCFCPPRLSRVAINGPATLTEGTSSAYWATAFFDNGASPSFTNSIWTTSDTNRFPITTNAILTAGSVTSNTPISVSTFFSYLGVLQTTNKAVTILNLPPPLLANSVRLPDGSFQLSVSGVVGRQHVIEATTNLLPPIQWTALSTGAISPGAPLIFTDRAATNYGRRFYRAREF